MAITEANSLYICTTPFQIMSSISLAQMKKESADICIDPQFMNAAKYIANLSKEELFSGVYSAIDSPTLSKLRTPNKGFVKKALMLGKLFSGKQMYCELVHGHKKYRTIYTSSNNDITRYLMNYILKRGWNTEIVFFDDGEGSYDDTIVYGLGGKEKKLIYRLVMKEIGEQAYSIYLYSPEYYKRIHPNTNYTIYQLPRWNKNQETMAIIERVFELDGIEQIEERYVLLDIIRAEVFNPTDSDRYKSLINRIIETVGKESICVKKHPRDLERYEDGVKEYGNRSIPFECIMTQFKGEDKVLISLTSTSVFMPKILLDREYYIILLYRLFQLQLGDETQRDELYKLLAEDYRNQSRIMIPSNEGELLACLDRLKSPSK